MPHATSPTNAAPATPRTSWLDQNQQWLNAELAHLQTRMEQSLRDATQAAGSPARTEDVPWRLSSPPALEALTVAFGLTPFERELLLLCAGVEVDARFGALCAALNDNPAEPWPTFALAFHICAAPAWESLSPGRPLRRWQLLALEPTARPLTTTPLRLVERVLHHLTGVDLLTDCMDAELAGLVHSEERGAQPLPPAQAALAAQLTDRLRATLEVEQPPVILVHGADPEAGREIVRTVCANAGLRLFTLRAGDLPAEPLHRSRLARVWEREAALSRAALLIDGDGGETLLARWLDNVAGPIFVTARQPDLVCRRAVVRRHVPRPTRPEQRLLWGAALAGHHVNDDGTEAHTAAQTIERLVNQFDLDAHQINAVGQQTPEAGELWDACRSQARPRLDELAQRIEPVATWDDLVVPVGQLHVLREMAVHVRRRAQVYDTWEFASKSSRGLGISALFAGSSGTGKTMAAEVLANELHLDLYRVDLSGVVSKYIGETEKNLRQVFDAADHGGAILLFDEADALFGKRAEVRDSHDRYANIEVSYLLQRMEAYRGLAILTTNQRSALDTAFLRRIRFLVEFPFPDAAQRVEIWRRVFPSATPTTGLDLQKLSRLNVAGGNIRNIALNAAFLAADQDEPVQMGHLLTAAQREYAKLEKTVGEAEVRAWVK